MENLRNKLFIGFFFLTLLIYLWCFIDLESAMGILAPPRNRELGLIEIAQGVIILICLWVGIENSKKKNSTPFWLLFSFAILFIFLEEIDYGFHYLEFILGKEPYTLNLFGFRNIHNQGSNNKWIKLLIKLCQIILFGILPFTKRFTKIKYPAKAYGFFFWFITLNNPFFDRILLRNMSTSELQLFDKTQLIGELGELAYYLILVVFISEYREEITQLFHKRKF